MPNKYYFEIFSEKVHMNCPAALVFTGYTPMLLILKKMLEGVIVAEIRDSETKKIITAQSAEVLIEPHKNTNQVTVIAHDAYQFDELGQAYSEVLPLGGEFGSLLSDKIKFKKISEMKRIRSDPMQFDPISRLANQAYLQLIAELFSNDIASKFAAGSEIQLQSPKQLIRFSADNCKPRSDGQVELSGRVVVKEYELGKKSDQPSYTYRSSRAVLEMQNASDGAFMEMIITGTPEWTRPDGTRGWSSQHIVKNLALPAGIGQKLSPNILQTIASMPNLVKQPSSELTKLQSKLKEEIDEGLADISIEINWRLVFGIGCIGLILIGTGLGIIFKGGHLLTAFGASAVPAAILIVCIVMGKNIASHYVATGILLMWLSLGLLAVLTFVIYRKLLKN